MNTAVTALIWVGVASLGTIVLAFWVALVKVWRDGK
jgi:hypothetical protein